MPDLQTLRRSLTLIRDQTGATVLLYMGNDDCHFLEPLLDKLAADGLCVNLAGRVCKLRGLVFCGMNKVRDYPFGYKHYCVPDGDYVASPIQFMGEGVTYDLTGKRSTTIISSHLVAIFGILHPVAFPIEFQDDRMMDQTVDGRRCRHGT